MTSLTSRTPKGDSEKQSLQQQKNEDGKKIQTTPNEEERKIVFLAFRRASVKPIVKHSRRKLDVTLLDTLVAFTATPVQLSNFLSSRPHIWWILVVCNRLLVRLALVIIKCKSEKICKQKRSQKDFYF